MEAMEYDSDEESSSDEDKPFQQRYSIPNSPLSINRVDQNVENFKDNETLPRFYSNNEFNMTTKVASHISRPGLSEVLYIINQFE